MDFDFSVFDTSVQLTEGRSARNQPKQPPAKKKSSAECRQKMFVISCISLLLPISLTGDGCCSCQNLSFLRCKVFWVQPIELRGGVAVTAFQVPAKAAGSATVPVLPCCA